MYSYYDKRFNIEIPTIPYIDIEMSKIFSKTKTTYSFEPIVCPNCNGDRVNYLKYGYETCRRCKGWGRIGHEILPRTQSTEIDIEYDIIA